MTQPENSLEFPKASIIEKRNDARFLVQVIGQLEHRNEAINVIEVGVCDGGSAYLMLAASRLVRLLSFSAPCSIIYPSENRQPPPIVSGNIDTKPDDSPYAGRWAIERLTARERQRWKIIYESSHSAMWHDCFYKACREWEECELDVYSSRDDFVDLIVIDGDHSVQSTFDDLLKTRTVPLSRESVILVHDADEEGVRAACEDFSERYNNPVQRIPSTGWYMFRPGIAWCLNKPIYG